MNAGERERARARERERERERRGRTPIAAGESPEGKSSTQPSKELLIRTGRCSYRVSASLLGPADPSFRALSGRLEFTVRRQKFNKDSLFKPPGRCGANVAHVREFDQDSLLCRSGGRAPLEVKARARTLSHSHTHTRTHTHTHTLTHRAGVGGGSRWT